MWTTWSPVCTGVQEQPLEGEFCVFDTGDHRPGPGCEYLTEIGAVCWCATVRWWRSSTPLSGPPKPITPKITELTGITNEMVADAPQEGEALQAFLDFAGWAGAGGPQRQRLRHPLSAGGRQTLRHQVRAHLHRHPDHGPDHVPPGCTTTSRAPSTSTWSCPLRGPPGLRGRRRPGGGSSASCSRDLEEKQITHIGGHQHRIGRQPGGAAQKVLPHHPAGQEPGRAEKPVQDRQQGPSGLLFQKSRGVPTQAC